MSTRRGARVAVLVFPGTNSEEETIRACRAGGLETHLVSWTASAQTVRGFDAYVLPGGFAYEDRVRAGAIAAHDRLMESVREGAAAGKLVLGICNGAQILLEAGLAPDLDGSTRPQAGFTRNLPGGRYRSTHVHVRLAIAPERCAISAALPSETVLPAWASHGEGRLAADSRTLEAMQSHDHLAFVYCDRAGVTTPEAIPNGSALGVAGVVNRAGNVLALMPHPERDAWTFMHNDASRAKARGDRAATLGVSGGIALFQSFAAALR
ncbi:MAG TPA: phosphoribosylformylglycinamidine synthase I [Candidatus Acidoferrales bacterium]|nr:phosphoribosylformylglycinamidine synthase I [Candidatus Acidoferrales bacterium]